MLSTPAFPTLFATICGRFARTDLIYVRGIELGTLREAVDVAKRLVLFRALLSLYLCFAVIGEAVDVAG